MIPEVGELVLYMIGVGGSIAVIGAALRIRHLLARLLVAMMIGWMFNSLLLCCSFILLMQNANVPDEWRVFRMVNALLIAILPVALYMGLWWEGKNGRT